MTKETLNFIIIGVLVIVGGVSSWELISTQQLFLLPPEKTNAVDYAQLERVVSSWEERAPFSFEATSPSATSSAEVSEEENEEDEMISIYIRNGTGEPDGGAELIESIGALVGVEIVSTTAMSQTAATSIAHKEDVPEDIINNVQSILGEEYEEVGVSTLLSTSPADMIVTLGSGS